ncbi:MAG: M67 family metallopeptidase [Acidimicrobiia bacterium]
MPGPEDPAPSIVVRLRREDFLAMVAHCQDTFPEEGCGLLAGRLLADSSGPDGSIGAIYPCRNEDASARTYTVDSRDLIRALRHAESQGLELIGVFHSHTHTAAYPSPTDVRQAPDPNWLYLIVSLEHAEAVLRAYSIRDGNIREVPVVLEI